MSTTLAKRSDNRDIPTEYQGRIEPNYYCRAWNPRRVKYCRAIAGWGTAHHGVGRCRHHGGQKVSGDARITHGKRSLIQPERLRDMIAEMEAIEQPLDIAPELAIARALMRDFINRHEEFAAALLAWHSGQRTIDEEERLALLRSLEELEAIYAEREPTSRQQEDLRLARDAVAFLAEPRVEKPRQILDISDAVAHADTVSKIIFRVQQHQSQNAVSYPRLKAFLFGVSRILENRVKDPALVERINEDVLALPL